MILPAGNSEQRRPCQGTPRLGFTMNAESMPVEITDAKRQESQDACSYISLQGPDARLLALLALQTVSFLNFSRGLVPGRFCHLRHERVEAGLKVRRLPCTHHGRTP